MIGISVNPETLILMWHLDTNIVIAYLNGNKTIAERIRSKLPDIAISSVVLAELLFGARASARREENLSKLEMFVQLVQIVGFEQKGADSYSKIRLSLKQKGSPIGKADMLIAAKGIC